MSLKYRVLFDKPSIKRSWTAVGSEPEPFPKKRRLSSCSQPKNPSLNIVERIESFTSHVKKKREEMDQDIWNSIGEHLCLLLGLKTGSLKESDDSDEEDIIDYWLSEELVRNTRELASENKWELSVNVLEELGFTAERLTQLIDDVPPECSGHRTAIDWVKIYIENEFQNNIPLTADPFQDNLFGEWFNPSEDQCAELTSKPRKVFKISGRDESYTIQDGEQFPGCLEDDNHRVLYHGTALNFGMNIMKKGISLKRCPKNNEFSRLAKGFYLGDSLQCAVVWSARKFPNRTVRAVLIYQVPNNVFERHRILDLTEDKARWREVCQYYLRIKKSKNPNHGEDQYQEYDLIEGPMVDKNKSKSKNFQYIYENREVSKQVCIKSDELANEFNNYLHSVLLFYKNK